MSLWQRFTQWQQVRFLREHPVDQPQWLALFDRLPWLNSLSAVERAHLRINVARFLAAKQFFGAHDLALTPAHLIHIAAVASLLWPHEDDDIYPGWVEVIVYPGGFRAVRSQANEAGIVTQASHSLAGESWLRGPVILSWEDIVNNEHEPHSPHHLVIHEFAHKLDGMNGAANGMPPLPAGMSIAAWTSTLSAAYERLCRALESPPLLREHSHAPAIDPYGATNPAEFFAVLCEVFFRQPAKLAADEPEVFARLCELFQHCPGIGLIPAALRQGVAAL